MVNVVSIRRSFALAVLAAVVPAATAVLELRPNLIALPAHDVQIVMDVLGRPTLRFGATVANLGEGALALVAGETGLDRKGNSRQNVYQRISLDDGTSYDRLAGTFVWHPNHTHFHFEDFALYTLQPVSARGRSQRTSSKTSFCLMDTVRIDGSLPGSPNAAFYEGCGASSQGISVGWGDEYGAHLPGQEILLTDLADGDYQLIVAADAKARLLETNDADNTSCVLLRLGISTLSLDVLNPDGCGASGGGSIVVSSISPDTAMKGSLTAISITGSGFAQGLNVSFTNGSGPRPVASDVTVVSSTRITGVVTIKGGGAATDPIWDLVVGGQVLPDSMTVLP